MVGADEGVEEVHSFSVLYWILRKIYKPGGVQLHR